MRWYTLYLSRAFMSFRECWITDRRREAQEEVVADLHSCLEQLTYRSAEMETKIDKSKQRALYHMKLSQQEQTKAGVLREKTRARMFMLDRQRLQGEHDKALKSMHMLQQQIDSIVSSHVDMVIVDAMRGFNATAAKLGLPQRAAEIERLSESLSDRQQEVDNIHEAMTGITAIVGRQHNEDDNNNMQDNQDSLMHELELMMLSAPSSPTTNADNITTTTPTTTHHVKKKKQEEETKEEEGEEEENTPLLLQLPSPPVAIPSTAAAGILLLHSPRPQKQLITVLSSSSYT